MKEIKNSTINIMKKAYWLMKTLEKECIEEAKVSFDDSTFLSFVSWALEEGFLDINIQSSIKRALLRCQCESVGEGIINHSECNINIQRVILCAKSFLNCDLISKNQRWNSLVSSWRNSKEVYQVDEESQTLEEFFASLGFNSLKFHLYSQFKEKTLSQEAILRCSKILAVMLQVEKAFEFRKIKKV